eukprot:CAMPEP_0172813542 /NCGR_PEP_ID=MMETSP1075-20121228/10728_1 /TAXON_ID=2916 /ORGANISM="Ceratium fusus, Strain PA161109" /LENGTH=164 /DNA_ID=CAMNT_0013653257 /DNA_START=134 /DNA_END=630 /DNA_ORIENTATION=+
MISATKRACGFHKQAGHECLSRLFDVGFLPIHAVNTARFAADSLASLVFALQTCRLLRLLSRRCAFSLAFRQRARNSASPIVAPGGNHVGGIAFAGGVELLGMIGGLVLLETDVGGDWVDAAVDTSSTSVGFRMVIDISGPTLTLSIAAQAPRWQTEQLGIHAA